MTIEARSRPWSAERGARRLFACVQDACGGSGDLPTCLDAALRAALEMLADEPSLAHLVAVYPYLDGGAEALDAQRGWIGRFGELLREAAEDDPRASREPSFLAPFLVGGVRFQIARLVLNGESSELPRLLPSLLEGLLSYYFEPGEPKGLAAAALAGR